MEIDGFVEDSIAVHNLNDLSPLLQNYVPHPVDDVSPNFKFMNAMGGFKPNANKVRSVLHQCHSLPHITTEANLRLLPLSLLLTYFNSMCFFGSESSHLQHHARF